MHRATLPWLTALLTSNCRRLQERSDEPPSGRTNWKIHKISFLKAWIHHDYAYVRNISPLVGSKTLQMLGVGGLGGCYWRMYAGHFAKLLGSVWLEAHMVEPPSERGRGQGRHIGLVVRWWGHTKVTQGLRVQHRYTAVCLRNVRLFWESSPDEKLVFSKIPADVSMEESCLQNSAGLG